MLRLPQFGVELPTDVAGVVALLREGSTMIEHMLATRRLCVSSQAVYEVDPGDFG
jgi:hypothetical protein